MRSLQVPSDLCTQKRIFSAIMMMQREISASKSIANELLNTSSNEDVKNVINQQLGHLQVTIHILHALMRTVPVYNFKVNDSDV